MDHLLRRIEALEKHNRALSFAIKHVRSNVEIPAFFKWCMDNNLNETQADFITDTCRTYATIMSHEKLNEGATEEGLGQVFLTKSIEHYLSTYPEIPQDHLSTDSISFSDFDQTLRMFLSKDEHGYPLEHFNTEEILYCLYSQYLYKNLASTLLLDAKTDVANYYLDLIEQEGQS